MFGFIIPIQTLHQPNCESLRNLLVRDTSIDSVADLSQLKVFAGPIVKNCIIISRKQPPLDNVIEIRRPQTASELLGGTPERWMQSEAAKNPGMSLKVDLLSPRRDLCEKLKKRSWTLDELCYVTFGLRSCAPGKGEGGKDRLIVDAAASSEAKPYLEGRDIGRYSLRPTGRFILYRPREMYSPRSPVLFESPKIISQTMLSRMRLVATIDRDGYYVEQSLACVLPHGVADRAVPAADVPLEFILAMINSRLQQFFFATYIIDYSLGGGLVHATPGSQGKLLVPRAPGNAVKKVCTRVNQMLDLYKRLAAAKTDQEKTALERQIAATNDEIDRLVYDLYGLTEEEIRIVEGNR